MILLYKLSLLWCLLTRIPLPPFCFRPTMPPLSTALPYITFVGALLGLLVAFPSQFFLHILPAAPAAWFSTFFYVLAGWSLHLDGWGDFWDGVGSGKQGSEFYSVMKDSHCGTFAVLALIFALAIRSSILSILPPEKWLLSLTLSSGLGRLSVCSSAHIGIYPWTHGLAQDVITQYKGKQMLLTLLLSFPFLILSPIPVCIMISIALAMGYIIGFWANRKIGGVNGDVLGASAVAGELAMLLICYLL